MSALINSINKQQAWKLTENGQEALNTTFDAMLDMFGVIGGLRTREDSDIIDMFMQAWGENPTLALKMLFYCRDCRGGQGEKRTFKIIAQHLANNHTAEMKRNMPYIPEYGRWDDLYAFDGTKLERDAYTMIQEQFNKDLEAETPSVLAKWMKSENTSSLESRKLGTKTRRYIGLTPKAYRKALATLRQKIDVVEKKMSANNWTEINYAGVPSIAHKNYRNAFNKHDPEGYANFLKKVESGEAEIKAAQLFPYDIIKAFLNTRRFNFDNAKLEYNETLEAQWKAMPKFLTDKNYLVMADTSGSMYSPNFTPIATSVGLAIKFAEENTGAYHNHFMTFSDDPRLVSLPEDSTLLEKIQCVLNDEYVGYSTNLEAGFDLILKSAIADKLPQSDMPEAILVISDMEINVCEGGRWSEDVNDSVTFTEQMKEKFEAAGYKMPTLIYWNVNARANTFHATKNNDVRFVSGCSPTIFKDLCENMGSSAIDFMINTLTSERYAPIK